MPAPSMPEDEPFDLIEYWDMIVDSRWLILAITAIATAIGGTYASLARPVYEANLLIQVEDTNGSGKSFLGEASSLVDTKTAAAAEMEILRSRMVIGKAVESTLLDIDARPLYLPYVGHWLARQAATLSEPGFLHFPGYVSGSERIAVAAFDVPPQLEGAQFRVTARGGDKYALSHPQLAQTMSGSVGVPLAATTSFGPISLLVSSLHGRSGAEFSVTRHSRLGTVRSLQGNLRLAEKGRQSGIIEATLQSGDREKLPQILNEIARQYVRQNVERKAAEAQKMLAFLDMQLPQFKGQLDEAEEAYNRYRNKQGTVALDQETSMILARSVDFQTKLLDAQQRRRELVSRFTAEHPVVRTLDEQIAVWTRESDSLKAKVQALPTVQQDVLRLQRDVKMNNDVYQSLRNNVLQLQLIREGKVGNVRLIDEAITPPGPIKPNRQQVLSMAALFGLVSGVLLVLARNAFFRAIRNPHEVEVHTGLSVYSTIPLSQNQQKLGRATENKEPGLHLLAALSPHDAAVESLRSLRTALQFAMLEAPNNRVLVTGATPGVGKTFISANFAAILASAGKRVLLIDADLRKGHLNSYFGIARERGLSEVVAGSLKFSEAVRREVLPNLDLLTTGVLPPNPAELMMSAAFAHVLDELSPQYDLVIMDTPPVLAAADTVGVAGQAGTLLMVARAARTQMGELHESSKRLAQAGKAVSGVLFNAMDLSRRHYGRYGYKYGRYKYRHYAYSPARL
jgi:tyrosine-protein kinase Etk/Wzc